MKKPKKEKVIAEGAEKTSKPKQPKPSIKKRSSHEVLEAIANVFRIPDLRKRLLFALAMLAVYRLGGHMPIPGIDAQRFRGFHPAEPGNGIRLLRSVQRRDISQADDLRAGHHALHHLLHHSAVVDRGRPHARKTAKGRRARPAQDYPVDPLSDRDPGPGSVLRYRQRCCRARSRASSRIPASASR